MSLEAEAFTLGIWDNFDDMELHITMEELEAILDAKRKQDMDNWRFQASLKGINLDEESGETGETFSLQDKINEYHAIESGMTKEAYEFAGIGISMESEDE